MEYVPSESLSLRELCITRKIACGAFPAVISFLLYSDRRHSAPRCLFLLSLFLLSYLGLTLSVTQSAFASTSDRPLCFPRACVGLIGPRPSDYPHALSACYYFLPAVFLLALGLWSSLPARQLSLDTSYSFLIFSVFFFFFFFFFKVLKG